MSSVSLMASSKLPTPWGIFTLVGFQEIASGKDHAALVMGDITTPEPVLGRIHSECLTGDALGSLRCDCRDQLGIALDAIDKNGCGMVIYLRQEGRGIGLLNKVNAYKLQDEGLNTYEANHQLGFASDERNFEIVEYILSYYGIKKIKLLTNNPKKLESIKGVEIVERLPVIAEKHELNKNYLKAKQEFGHLL